jgi:hypothetical protein
MAQAMKIKAAGKIFIMVIPLIMVAFLGGGFIAGAHLSTHSKSQTADKNVTKSLPAIPPGYCLYDYSPSAGISYAMLVHTNYFGKNEYPAAINLSIMQKNLDYYNSEDCSHFVSEALIAGGLKELAIDAPNGPGDNLSGYDGGKFVGSYGIVGVYRLVSYLAGYVLPIFSTNATAESTLGYQPVPASFQGSPLASIYYVLNESMYPAYYLSPGDVIADGGVGGGHIMYYIGNGTVVQTDPAEEWQYQPGADCNISFYGLDTLHGKNVTALYIHIPTFHGAKTVRITALYDGSVLNDSTTVKTGSSVYLIGSFPDGVGLGNYTYTWLDNGKTISNQQNFTYTLQSGTNNIELVSSGSNGTAYQNFTIYSGQRSSNASFSTLEIVGIVVVVVAIAAVATALVLKRKN